MESELFTSFAITFRSVLHRHLEPGRCSLNQIVKERIEQEHFVCPSSIFSLLAAKSSNFLSGDKSQAVPWPLTRRLILRIEGREIRGCGIHLSKSEAVTKLGRPSGAWTILRTCPSAGSAGLVSVAPPGAGILKLLSHRFAAYMWVHPGKKLLFMGQEIGQREEWNHNSGIRWELLEFEPHRKLQTLMRELNRLYRASPSLYQVDFHYSGFEWVDFRDSENSVISFLRRAEDPKDFLLVCCNFTPVPRQGYEIGVPEEGF